MVLAVPVLAFGVGLAVGSAAVGGHLVVPTSDRTASEPRGGSVWPLGGTAAGVLRRTPENGDRPVTAVGATLVPASFRVLTVLPGSGTLLYAARDRAGRPCLAAVAEDGRLTAACLQLEEFRQAPIVLVLPVDTGSAPQVAATREVVVRWYSSGQILWRHGNA